MTPYAHASAAHRAPTDDWTRRSALIVAFCFMLNMVDGMDILILSYIAPALQAQWQVTPGELSIVFSSGLAGMAVGGLGLAPLADRLGRRPLIVFAMALMAGAMLASSYSRSVAELAFIRLFVGTGIGTVLACIAATAAQVAPQRHRAFAVGVLQAGYPIGAVITGFVTAWALPHVGWHGVLVGTAAVSALFVPLALFVLPAGGGVQGARPARLAEIVAGSQLRSSVLLWCATICGFMALYFINSWITKLAIEAGLPETQAIVASAIYNLGAFSGTFAMSVAGTRIDVRRICGTLLAVTAGVFLFFGGVTLPLAGLLVTAFVMGATMQGGLNMLYPIAALVYPERLRATGIGWAFGIGRIGAFTGPLLGGWALAQDWPLVAVFGIFCVPLLIGALCAFRIRTEDAE